MKRKGPPLWLCVLLLLLVLVWRMLGAPLTAREFAQAGTPLWQARTLLPGYAGFFHCGCPFKRKKWRLLTTQNP